MIYKNVRQAFFVSRKNRFLAEIEVDGKICLCHVKNTGRLKELLTQGTRVYAQEHNTSERKTKYSLVAVEKDGKTVNIDSQAPNKVFYEWVKKGCFADGVTLVKPEKTYGNSRFDCYIETPERKIFVEVKGVTLEKDGVAMFPDAPTERGVKHLHELCRCIGDGYEAYIVFVVQMKGVTGFTPNRKTHEEFANALVKCKDCGVKVLCVDCNVTYDRLEISDFVEVRL